MRRAAWLALLAGLLAACSQGGAPVCRIGVVADLPLLAGRPMPTVQATLDGRAVALLIDTGAAISVIDKKAAEQFHLVAGPQDGLVRLHGIGGSVFARLVMIHHLGLGHGMARNIELPVAGDLGPPVQGMPVLGLFGADFLSNYDVDLDMPHHHFALYALHACGSHIQPFDAPFFECTFQLRAERIELSLKLNGTPMTAILDSASSVTTILPEAARRAGITREALAVDRAERAVGIDENRVDGRRHRFASLDIGDERMRNFAFAVAAINADYTLLGDDFLRFNRVWISYPLERLFIQPVAPHHEAHR